jgi:hypothetical protein
MLRTAPWLVLALLLVAIDAQGGVVVPSLSQNSPGTGPSADFLNAAITESTTASSTALEGSVALSGTPDTVALTNTLANLDTFSAAADLDVGGPPPSVASFAQHMFVSQMMTLMPVDGSAADFSDSSPGSAPDFANDAVGSNPEPASLVLWSVLGCMGIAVRRYRSTKREIV